MSDSAAPPEVHYSTRLDDPIYLELVEQYVEEIPDRIATLLSAFESDDLVALERAAHQLKGSTAGYGFMPVTPFAARLESAVKSSEPHDRLVPLVNGLITELRKMRSGTPE